MLNFNKKKNEFKNNCLEYEGLFLGLSLMSLGELAELVYLIFMVVFSCARSEKQITTGRENIQERQDS